MQMKERAFAAEGYRYGFNGQEQDGELMDGAVVFKYRVHDPRIGKFLSVDPLSPQYPWYTPYQFAGNEVITSIDVEGAEPRKNIFYWNDDPRYLREEGKGNITYHRVFDSKDSDEFYWVASFWEPNIDSPLSPFLANPDDWSYNHYYHKGAKVGGEYILFSPNDANPKDIAGGGLMYEAWDKNGAWVLGALAIPVGVIGAAEFGGTAIAMRLSNAVKYEAELAKMSARSIPSTITKIYAGKSLISGGADGASQVVFNIADGKNVITNHNVLSTITQTFIPEPFTANYLGTKYNLTYANGLNILSEREAVTTGLMGRGLSEISSPLIGAVNRSSIPSTTMKATVETFTEFYNNVINNTSQKVMTGAYEE
jgi:RHS repeat-associated protein